MSSSKTSFDVTQETWTGSRALLQFPVNFQFIDNLENSGETRPRTTCTILEVIAKLERPPGSL